MILLNQQKVLNQIKVNIYTCDPDEDKIDTSKIGTSEDEDEYTDDRTR